MAKAKATDPKGEFPNEKGKGEVLQELLTSKKTQLAGKKLKEIWTELQSEVHKIYKDAKWEFVEANVKQTFRDAAIKAGVLTPQKRDGSKAKPKAKKESISSTDAINLLTELKASGLDLDIIKKAMTAVEKYNQKQPDKSQNLETVVAMLESVENARKDLEEQQKKLTGLGF